MKKGISWRVDQKKMDCCRIGCGKDSETIDGLTVVSRQCQPPSLSPPPSEPMLPTSACSLLLQSLLTEIKQRSQNPTIMTSFCSLRNRDFKIETLSSIEAFTSCIAQLSINSGHKSLTGRRACKFATNRTCPILFPIMYKSVAN